MPDEAMLYERARIALHEGRLPTRRPDRTYGGHGTGSVCALCGMKTIKEEAELEIEFDRGGNPGMDRHYLHPRCFAAWEFERTKLAPQVRTAPG